MTCFAKELGLEADSRGTQLRLNEGRTALRASRCGEAKENIQLVEANHCTRLRERKSRLGLVRQCRGVRSGLVVLGNQQEIEQKTKTKKHSFPAISMDEINSNDRQ